VSGDILFDSIAALGLMIAFYYGITGFACVWYFRHDLTKSARNFWLVGVAPLLGGITLGAIFVKSCSTCPRTTRARRRTSASARRS